jgi:cytochrome c-type biogenesis protein CcmH
LARDLRVLVRQRIAAGDSDSAVIDYVVARYGDFVRLKPPFDAHTWALWLGGPILLIAGVATIVVQRRRRPAAPEPLTEAERQRLDELLK